MKLTLADRVIVVTGAASGIGRAVARQVAASGVGGLLLSDRDEDGLVQTVAELGKGGAVVKGLAADLSDIAAPADIAAATVAQFGRIDGLVNAAGLTTRASFLDATPEVWEELFAVNTRAAFFLMQAAITDMRARQAPGSIVNIGSMNAHCGAADLAVYSATKGALATLTKNAASAHMADRIRVNAINLGWVATDAEHRMQTETLGLGADWAEKAAAGLPLGRLVTAEEAARLALFLLSDASEPMSGVVTDLEQRVVG